MKAKLIWLVLYLTCVMSQHALAEEETPDMALLEFLGSFETDDEQWFDPTLLVDVEILDENLEKRQNNERD